HRLAGDAIEDIEPTLFRRLRDCLDRAAVDGDVGKDRRIGNVHVPDAVMHELIVPFAPAGHQIERDQRLAEETSARAMTAVIVAGGQFDGDVDGAESFVDRHLSPRAGIAGVFPRTLFPGVVAELSWARDRMENPQPSAGAHIEGADVALLICEAFRRAARKMRGADEDDIRSEE